MSITPAAVLVVGTAFVASSANTSLSICNESVSRVGDSGYVVNKVAPLPNKDITITNDFLYAYRQISDISVLGENWNGNGARPFDSNLIKMAQRILYQLKIYPEVFPLSSGELQLEYYRDDGAYLQVKMNLDDRWDCFVAEESSYNNFTVPADAESLNLLVDAFYERKF